MVSALAISVDDPGEDEVTLIPAHSLDERDRAIIDLLREHGVMSLTDIARALRVSKSVAHRRLKSLEDRGIIIRIRGRRGRPLYRLKHVTEDKP